MKPPTLACGKLFGVILGDLGVTTEQGGPVTAASPKAARAAAPVREETAQQPTRSRRNFPHIQHPKMATWAKDGVTRQKCVGMQRIPHLLEECGRPKTQIQRL